MKSSNVSAFFTDSGCSTGELRVTGRGVAGSATPEIQSSTNTLDALVTLEYGKGRGQSLL